MNTKISEREIPLNSGKIIHEITLSNGQLRIVVHDFGARIYQIFTPDREGNLGNVLLSRDDPDSYDKDIGYYGLICGPVAGRIKDATYDTVVLEANEGNNLLHSGNRGWERQFWSYEMFQNDKSVGIVLSLKDEISGFPGPIEAQVVYELKETTLTIKMKAYSKTSTVFNPAFHPYFNLSADKESTLEHILKVPTDRVVEVDEQNIPTGRLLPVSNTIYDLREGTSIGQIQEKLKSGFDNCFVYPEQMTNKMLSLHSPISGRKMICKTDRQAVVIFTATDPEQESMISGTKMTPNRGIAIEFQEFPDMVHHPEWGSIVLPAGETKTFVSTYTFLAE